MRRNRPSDRIGAGTRLELHTIPTLAPTSVRRSDWMTSVRRGDWMMMKNTIPRGPRPPTNSMDANHTSALHPAPMIFIRLTTRDAVIRQAKPTISMTPSPTTRPNFPKRNIMKMNRLLAGGSAL
jgi:hypothetical protein